MATYADLRNSLDGLISRGGLTSQQVAAIHAALRQGGNWSSPEAKDAFGRLGIDLNSEEGQTRAAQMQQAYRLVVTHNENDTIGPEGNWDVFAKTAMDNFNGQNAIGGSGAPTENTDDVTNRINKFLADLDPNSPQTQAMYQYIQKRGQATQGAASARAGLGSVGSGQGGGGLSAYGQQMVQGDLANKYDLQRKSLQAQGVGLLNQRDLGLKGLEQGYMQMQNQQQEQAWAAKQNQAQGIGAAIGGGLGALGFIGGPALGAATMAGGAALGGGLGGLATGGSGPSYPSMPSWMSGSGRKGSLGGSGY